MLRLPLDKRKPQEHVNLSVHASTKARLDKLCKQHECKSWNELIVGLLDYFEADQRPNTNTGEPAP